ncbi:MAG: acyl-CoA synthetase [Pseudomonadota bacterium]|nr:acyl-CoA synthetase [Pseudomonadota bacterium]
MATYGFWAWAAQDPDRLALVTDDGEEMSFGALGRRVNQLSHGLRSLGLKRGDLVAVLLPNESAWIEVFMATQQIGLYMTAINYHLTGPEIAYILENSEAKAFVANARYAEAARTAAEALKFPVDRRFSVGEISGFRPYASLHEGQPETAPPDREAGQLMLYTSGTTGRPKGVRRALTGGPPEAAAMMGSMLSAMFDIKPGEGVHLAQGPLYHAAPGAFSTGAMHQGQSLVLMDKWTPEGCLERIEKYRVTATHMVPTMFHRLLKLPEEVRARYDVSSLRSVIHAAAPCPVDTKRKMMEWWGPVIYEYYAATEGGGAYVKPKEWLEHPGTVGRAFPGATLKILDDDGGELGPGEVGTIYMGSPMGEFEYYKDKDKTEKARQGGMFTVGDMGYLDQDGWLYISDRKTDMIISGGVNIYPAEIEAVLHQHPKVADVAVFGVPDEDWGESVKAVIEPLPGVSSGPELAEEILEFASRHLASYKIPRTVDFNPALPRLPTGKLYKRLLRDEYWKDAGKKV